MPRSALVVLVAGTVAVLVAAAAALALDERTLAFANGIAPRDVVVELRPGQRACQREVAVVEPFGGLQLAADTGGRPGPRLKVALRGGSASGSGGVRATVQEGYVSRLDDPETGPVAAFAGEPVTAGPVEACIENLGDAPIALAGTRGDSTGSLLVGAGDDLQRADADLALNFLRERPTSLLAQLPAAFERAALFHPPVVGAWTFWLLTLVMAVGVPVLLGVALRAAWRAEESESP